MSTHVSSPGASPCCGVSCPGSASSYFGNKAQDRARFGRHPKQNNELEDVILQSMKGLSFDELQREQEEVHGICNDFKEDTEVIDGLIESLSQHLSQIKEGTAYETLELLNPSYATRRDLQIIFLRGNRYEPKPSAKQMIKYFDLKQELFGVDCLGRDITTDDLTEEDMETLLEGSLQIANCTDQSGRMIAVGFAGLRGTTSVRSELRVRFFQSNYIVMEANSRGVIIISYSIGQYQDARNGEGFIEAMRLTLAMPCNIAGFHLVADNVSQCTVAKVALSMFPARIRAKIKIHFGSYGMPKESIPLDPSTNAMDLTNHKIWFETCKKKEQLKAQSKNQLSTSSTTIPADKKRTVTQIIENIPNDNDVFCIGRKVNGVGNDRLMKMAVLHAEAYDMSSSKGRKGIINSMIEEIQKQGGRFLKPHTTESGNKRWIEVTEKEVYEKIGQMFRNLRRRQAG